MPFTVQSLLDRLARAFEQKRFTEMVDDFSYPLPLYLEDKLLVASTPEVMEGTLSAYRRLFAFRGITAIHPCVEEVMDPEGERLCVRVGWMHEGPDGPCPGSRATLYLRRGDDGRLRIEMMHYTHMPVAEIKAYQPRAA